MTGAMIADVVKRLAEGEDFDLVESDEAPDGAVDVEDVRKALADDISESLDAAMSREIAPVFKADYESEERYTLGIVLEPNDGAGGAPLDPDSQGDIYSAATIRAAQREYMAKFQRIGRQHGSLFSGGDATLVDSFVVPMESEGLAVKTADGGSYTVRPGTWLQGVVWSEPVWKEIKAGTFTGWSIGGKGYRTPVS